MMILGPLVAPSTSTVTPALSRPVAVTVSPSTVITTGSVSVSPTAASVLSISMTSPTATFCCLLPARTIAYTAVSFVGLRTHDLPLRDRRPWTGHPSGQQKGHAVAHRGFIVRGARRTGQNDRYVARGQVASALAGATLALDGHVQRGRLVLRRRRRSTDRAVGRGSRSLRLWSRDRRRRPGRTTGRSAAGTGDDARGLGLARWGRLESLLRDR